MRSLERLESFLKRSIDQVLQNSKKVTVVVLGFVVVLGYFSTKLEKQVSIKEQLDPGMKSTQEFKRSEDLFGKQSILGFFIPSPTLGDLCTLKSMIPRLALKYSSIENSSNVLDIRRGSFDGKKLLYFPVLSNPCEQNPLTPFAPLSIAESPWKDTLISAKNSDVFTSFTLGFDAATVGPLMKDIQKEFPKEVLWGGTVAQDFYTDQGMNQSLWQNLLIVTIILGAFRIAFGTWKSCSIFFGTLAVPIVGVYGGMALFGHRMDPLSTCLFLMLTIAALEDFVFLSYAQADFVKTKENPTPFHALALSCFFTSLTTFIAFGSLSLSSMLSIRRFGYWASFGSALEWISVFLILPVFVKQFPRFSLWFNPERAFFRKISKSWVDKKPSRIFSWASLLFFVTALYSLNHARLTQTPTEIFPPDHPFQKAMDYIRDTRGWVADSHLVFESGVGEKQKNEVSAALEKDPIVTHIQRWHQIDDFIAHDVSGLTHELVSREIKSTRMSEDYLASTGEEAVTVYLKTTEIRELNRLRAKVGALCPNGECWLTGAFIAFADFSQSFLKTMFDSLALSLILVALVIFYLCWAVGELPNYFKLISTSFWGPAVLLTCLQIFGISVNAVTCIVASVLVGLTGDNAVQFLLAKGKGRLEDGIEIRGHSSIQCSVIMASCTLTFVFSYFEPARTLGLLLSFGFIFALIGDLWLLQGFLKKSQN